MRIEYGDDAVFVASKIMDGLRARGFGDLVSDLEFSIGEFSIEIDTLLTNVLRESDAGNYEDVARILGFKNSDELYDLFGPIHAYGSPFGPYWPNFLLRRRMITTKQPPMLPLPVLSTGEFTRIIADSIIDGETYKTVFPVNVVLSLHLMFTVSVLPLRCYQSIQETFKQLEKGNEFAFPDDETYSGIDAGRMEQLARNFSMLFTVSDTRWSLSSTAETLAPQGSQRSRSDLRDIDGIPIDFLLPKIQEIYRPHLDTVQLLRREIKLGSIG